jgi:hypothetical protein
LLFCFMSSATCAVFKTGLMVSSVNVSIL